MTDIRFIILSIFIALTSSAAWGQGSLVSCVDKLESQSGNDEDVSFASVSEKRVDGHLVGYNKIFVVKNKKLADSFVKAVMNERTKAYKYEQQIEKQYVYYRIEFKQVKNGIATYDIYSIVRQDKDSYAISVERKQKRVNGGKSSSSVNTSTSISAGGSTIVIQNDSVTLVAECH